MRRRFQKRQNEIIKSMQWVTDLAIQSPNVSLSMDVESAIGQLPDNQRQLCVALSQGYSTCEIARALQVNQRTIQRHICKIHAYFTSLNAQGWVLREGGW